MRRRESSVKELLTTEVMTTVKSIQFEFTQECEASGETINSLCNVLEGIFIHGLKETLADRMTSVLGDPDQRPSPEFWSVLMIFSHSEVIKQITKLSQITTDVGRSRAWLRLSLNEGMITSYLLMICQDNSSLTPYYKRFAFLRDLEALGVVTKLLEGLARFSFSLPTNSSVLNTWSNAPLLLAGLWTPPMKEVPISVGTDIVKGLPVDNDKAESISVCSIPSSSGRFGEEEAFKKILGTPVEGSPLHSHMCFDDSDEKSVSDVEVPFEAPSTSADVSAASKVTDTDKNQSEEVESRSDVQLIPNTEEETVTENSTLESYHKIIDSYKVDNSTVQKPNIDDIINKFGPSINKPVSPKHQTAFQRMSKSQTSNDFEVVEESALNFNIPEFKSLVEQLGKIVNEKGLIGQNFSCKECGQLIGLSFGNSCVCSLTGCYYCRDCFKSSVMPLPGRILHNWDFSRFIVCGKVATFLQEIQDFPLFDVRKINPKLYLVFSEMSSLQKLRLQLNFLRIYLFTCHDSVKERIKRILWPREYLYEHVHLYSLTDLLEIPSGKLVELLKRAIKISVDHVLTCQLCSQKGFICEVCHDEKAIYPFDIETTYRCPSCRTVYHLSCKKDICPKCERIKKRKENASSMSDM
ncbi:uncharacterized protein [Halyomorpha halys]|uniref:uncharacterized protein n=2 Tax=Halyomorpha halys TaxID=286706 RepID=UPI0006D4D103|nr:uncharacterized protein LOC106685625 [Halyomorpha halys]